jgi:hypothetical protein
MSAVVSVMTMQTGMLLLGSEGSKGCTYVFVREGRRETERQRDRKKRGRKKRDSEEVKALWTCERERERR